MYNVFHLECHNMSTAFSQQESFIIPENKQPNNDILIEHVNEI